MNMNTQNSYFKYNRIRSKLLLFIDNEIQSKIKQKDQNLNNCEAEITISFEESFSQKQTNKYDFSFSNIQTKKNDSSNKSISTIDDSPNKKSDKKERNNTHSKMLLKESNCPKKLLNSVICFNKKCYSIKHLSRQSSTFLILHKQKNAAEYLKNLCNNLKICKKNKKPVIHTRSISINTKFFDLCKDKKPSTKSNDVKMRKPKKVNFNTLSLFRNSQKIKFGICSKNQISDKSNNPSIIRIKQKK